MKSGALRRALGLTLLYIGCFVLLVMLQFSSGPGFSEKFGRLSVSASFPKTDRGVTGKAPVAVRLDYAGFLIELSTRSPARLVAADGSSRSLPLRSVEKRKDGVLILLGDGVELLAAAGQDDRYSLSAEAPAGTYALRLPYSLVGRARLSMKGNQARLDSPGASFDLSFPSSSIDATAKFITLGNAGDGGSLGRLAIARRIEAPVKPGKPTPTAVERAVAQAPKDAATFKAEIDAWRDKAWAGLSSGRYDADRLVWRGRADSPAGGQAGPADARFSEKALVAYLAESLVRGSYPEGLARMKAAKERWPDELGYLSAPYLGGLVKKMEVLEAADAVESKRLAQLVQEKSPDLFAKEGLVRFLFDRSSGTLAQDVEQFAASLDPAKLTIRQAVGLLGCVVESRSYLADDANPFRSLGATADRVASAIRSSSAGLFLVSEDDGSTDLRLSLVAGQALVAYGAAEGKTALVGLGQGLVEGVIGLADEQAIVPARLVVRSGIVEQKSGTLLPEEVYPLVAENPYYPRAVSFYRDIAPGVWAWTCAPSLSVTASATRYAFAVSFPEGRSHYMTFYGIKPFVNIQLYDIDYSPDSEFEIYDASGYLYKKTSSALYLKMKHKKESESIKLSF
jgi:hypothetical protein